MPEHSKKHITHKQETRNETKRQRLLEKNERIVRQSPASTSLTENRVHVIKADNSHTHARAKQDRTAHQTTSGTFPRCQSSAHNRHRARTRESTRSRGEWTRLVASVASPPLGPHVELLSLPCQSQQDSSSTPPILRSPGTVRCMSFAFTVGVSTMIIANTVP